jgi:hypothetical protein
MPSRSLRAPLALGLCLGSSLAASCTPAPVTAFEGFYAAMARRDVPAFRAALCPDAQAALAPLPDDAIAVDLAVTRVVRRVSLVSEDAVGAIVDVEDATGQHESVALHKRDGRWCVDAPTTAQAPAQAPTKTPRSLP